MLERHLTPIGVKFIMTKYEEIAKNEASKYQDYPGLMGILWVGSTSFGVEDELADIDIRILVNNSEKNKPMQQYEVSGVKVEVDEMNWNWLFDNLVLGSEQSWLIEKSIVLYDPNKLVADALDNSKIKLSKIDNKKLLWDNYSKLYLHYDLEKSLKRNQIISAHIILSEIIDSLSKFIFLYQNKPVPPQKWRWYMIEKEKLFNVDKVEKLVQLDLVSSRAEIISIIKSIQNDCQKIMMDLGFEKERVMEPWKF